MMNLLRCTFDRCRLKPIYLLVLGLFFVSLLTVRFVQFPGLQLPNYVGDRSLVASTNSLSIRFISPSGSGDGNGTSEQNAGVLTDLPAFVKAVGPGGEVRLLGGTYSQNGSISIDSGGIQGQPITIRGADAQGNETTIPLITGSRSNPYQPPPQGKTGSSLFKLLPGANHLVIRNIHCMNQGNGCIVFAGTSGDITIEQIKGTNVQRLIEHRPDPSQPNASWELANVTIRESEIHGYSKGAFRFGKPSPDNQADAHDLLIENIIGDSERQDGDDFCMGIHLRGDVHHAIVRRTTMSNCQQTLSSDKYWNGDGFTAEAGVSDLQFEDTRAVGNTDGGYDIKAANVIMLRTYAADNKRNFRFWSSIDVQESIGEEPHCRGGIGCQSQVYAGKGAEAVLTNCSFRSTNPSTHVFQSEHGGKVTMNGGMIDQNGTLIHSDSKENVITLNQVVLK